MTSQSRSRGTGSCKRAKRRYPAIVRRVSAWTRRSRWNCGADRVNVLLIFCEIQWYLERAFYHLI